MVSKIKRIIAKAIIIFAVLIFAFPIIENVVRILLPSSIRNQLGMYTLSEAIDIGSYGLIEEVLNDSLVSSYSLKYACKPRTKHMEVALENEWRDIVKLFLEYGADPNKTDSRGYTILDEAILHNSFKMCELLVNDNLQPAVTEDGNANLIPIKINKLNKKGNTALDELCKVSNEEMLEGEWEKRVQLLIEHGAEVSGQTRRLLKNSVHKDKIEWINSLLQGKEKKTATDFAKVDMEQMKQKTVTKEESYNLLKSLQAYGSVDTIQLLLDDKDLQIESYLDESQKQDLMEKAVADNTELMNIYLKKDFPVTTRALGEVIWSKNYDDARVKALINKENQNTVIKNWKENQDYSLFMIAVESNRGCAYDLFYNRANLDYKNEQGLTALKIAKEYNFETLYKLNAVIE